MTIAIFDIDGVVADVRHRLHYLSGHRKDWTGFFMAAADDDPLDVGVALVNDLASRHDIVWLTGRPDWLRSVTRDWLRELELPGHELHMRGNSDRRPARAFKLSVLRTLRHRGIAALIDDDDEVIEAAQADGFPATLADWLPRADTMRAVQDRLGRT